MRHLTTVLLALCLPSLVGAVTFRTTDGLALELADDGQVSGLSLQGRPLPTTPGGGFTVREAAAAAPAEPHLVRCPLLPDGGARIQKQRFDDLGLTFETSYAVAGEYLSFSAKLTDHTGQDRAVEAGFEIPFDGTGWTWGDDLNASRVVDEAICYRSVRPCDAGPGHVQLYPFTSLSKGAAGLSLGLPLSQGPRVCAIEYDHARKCLAIRFYLGLSPRVKKLPGQAWFSFLLVAHDGLWGMRAAAERYARLFPKDFVRRGTTEGYVGTLPTEAWDSLRAPEAWYDVPALGDFGGVFRHALSVTPQVGAEEVAGALKEFAARETRREPYTWCVTTDGGGAPLLWEAEADIIASEAPLSYATATRQVGGVDGAWRRNAKILAPLAEPHQLLVACRFPAAWPGLSADWPALDLGLVRTPAPAGAELWARTMAGTRPLRFWCDDVQQARGEQPLRDMLSRGLLYAIYPNLQADAPKHRDLYLQFVPIIERLSAAGWEPVTLARSVAPDVQIERYGRLAEGDLCFALRNAGEQPVTTTVLLDAALGLPGKPQALRVMNLLTDAAVTPVREQSTVGVPVKLLPGEATALLVLPTARYLQRMLLDAAEALRQATPLTAEEITYQLSRPGELRTGDTPPGARATTVLCDGWKTDQGLVFAAGEPLTISLDINAPHRLQWLRVHYGLGKGYAVPAATVEAVDREGTWHALGALAATTDAAWPASLLDVTDGGEYQRLRIVYPELTQRLWLKEIEIAGQDGALTRAAERFRAQAASGCSDFGVISQLAMVLRVRRMPGHDSTLQERALTYLADFCTATSGVCARLALPDGAPSSGPVKGQLVVSNDGDHGLREGSVKLKLPPGWSAAPGKFEVDLRAGERVRLPVTLSRSPEGGRLTLLITGVMDGTPLFMSREE